MPRVGRNASTSSGSEDLSYLAVYTRDEVNMATVVMTRVPFLVSLCFIV